MEERLSSYAYVYFNLMLSVSKFLWREMASVCVVYLYFIQSASFRILQFFLKALEEW